jgi:hypothetical protein
MKLDWLKSELRIGAVVRTRHDGLISLVRFDADEWKCPNGSENCRECPACWNFYVDPRLSRPTIICEPTKAGGQINLFEGKE